MAIAVAAFVASSSGCAGSPRPADVVVYASGSDLQSGNPLVTIHPLSLQVQRFALFVTLARYDSQLVPVPYAAQRWDWSQDRKTLSLHLAAGLRWQDGRPTTSRDVAFTLLAARDPATGYSRANDLASLDDVIAQNDSTVAIHFRMPQTSFPPVLCDLPILPAHLLENVPHAELKRAPFNTAPVGNGPFRFVERKPGQRWVFERNPDFPTMLGGPPKLAGLVIAVVDEPTTKFAGLASGDLDVAGISPTMAALASHDPSIRVLDYPVLFTTGLVFNVNKAPFNDVRVRRAINLSIDRDRSVHAALAGYGRPAGGPVPLENPLADSVQPRLDPALADSLLDAAGWRRGADGIRRRDGRPMVFDLLTVGSGDNAAEQLIQADLAARGIRMRISQRELGAFLTEARAEQKRFDALFTGIPGDLTLSYLSAMFESSQAGGTLDYGNFHSAKLDTLFAATRTATTPAARRDAWVSVQRELARDLPVAWIYHARGVQGVSARLDNVRMDLRGEMVTLAQWRVRSSGASERR